MKNWKLNLVVLLERRMAMISISIWLSFFSTLPISLIAQTISPCDAFINYTISTQNPLEVTFCNASEYATGAYGFNFQWDFGDGFTSYDSCVTHVYSVPGIYTICFWVSACDPNIGGVSCGDDTCITINLGGKATSAFETRTSINSLFVFPNPFDQEVQVTVDADDFIAAVEVLSLNGIRIALLHTSLKNMITLNEEIFRCEGQYILRITTLYGKVSSALISKF